MVDPDGEKSVPCCKAQCWIDYPRIKKDREKRESCFKGCEEARAQDRDSCQSWCDVKHPFHGKPWDYCYAACKRGWADPDSEYGKMPIVRSEL